MNIYLIGYRCTGKSSVGKSLAKILGWSFLDADVELVKEYKITISEIVATGGWESFRKKEKHVLKRLSSLDKHVIATGGGAILDEENVKNMKKSGVSIWLRATPETVKDRILKDETTEDSRPSLTSKGLMEEIEETLIYRNPFYKKAMDFSVDTDNIDIENVCLTVQKKLNRTGIREKNEHRTSNIERPTSNILKDERPTSNIERRTSNNDVATLFKLF